MDAQSLPSSSSLSSDSATTNKAVEEVGFDSSLSVSSAECHGLCAICLEKISLEQTAILKGCEHAYCVTCILQWATYKENPLCPQCKNPFESLNLHISLDGRIHDYMFEESVCLLLRAAWFVPVEMENEHAVDDDEHDVQQAYNSNNYSDDDIEESFFMHNLSSIRIGNRRWGNNGFVRAGRKEARPINKQKSIQRLDAGDAGPSRPAKVEASRDVTGRRAKRALKREAAEKAAMAKHQERLQKLGLK